MNETTELIMKQLNSKKVHAETHEVGGGDEIDALKLKNISDLVTKTGDFTGTWNGLAMTSVDGGLATAFNALKADTTQRGVNICAPPFNTVSDTDCTSAFKNAASYALTNEFDLFIPQGEYHIYLTSLGTSVPLSLPSLIGAGLEKTTLYIHGLLYFTIPTGFQCENIRIITDYTKLNTDVTATPYLFSNSVIMLENVIFKNVELINSGAATDGSSRGMGLFSGNVQGINFDNIFISGTKLGIRILNSGIVDGAATLYSKNIKYNQLRFENTQTGMYIGGNASWDKTNFVRDVKGTNISLINTETQRNNYTVLAGSDLLMFEKVRDIIISGLYVERACERATYFNVCFNVNVSNAELVSTEGLKFVGFSSVEVGAQYADGFTCTNVHYIDDDNVGRSVNPFVLYDCKNVMISNVQIDGKSIDTKFNVVLLASRYLENVDIDGVNARYLQKGFIQYNDETTAIANEIHDFSVKNINLIDAVVTTSRNDLIAFNIVAPPTAGTYIFRNFRLDNITSKSTVDYTAVTRAIGQKEYILHGDGLAAVNGLISVNHIDGLRIKNNVMEGFSSPNGMLFVGTNSRNIIIEEDSFWINLTSAPSAVTGLNFSYPTTLRMMEDNANGSLLERRFKSIYATSDTFGITRNILLNCEIEIDGRITLASSAEQRLIRNWVANCFGVGRVIASNGEWMEFAVNGVTVTKISSSTNFGVNNDVSMSSIFTYPSPDNYLALRNRTAGTLSYKFEFKGIFKQ